MPTTLPRRVAVARLTEASAHHACLACALLDGGLGPPLWLARGTHASAIIPRYATRFGHVMVVLHQHVTRYAAVTDMAWNEASALSLKAARAIERVIAPPRCYIASLGSPRTDLPMTCPHLHLHVIPLTHSDERPRTVLTWQNGVVVADEAEWQQLRDDLRAAW